MKSISFPAMKFIELMIDSGLINLAAMISVASFFQFINIQLMQMEFAVIHQSQSISRNWCSNSHLSSAIIPLHSYNSICFHCIHSWLPGSFKRFNFPLSYSLQHQFSFFLCLFPDIPVNITLAPYWVKGMHNYSPFSYLLSV